MLTFAQESIRDVYPEAEPLLMAHWREIAHFDDIPLEPKVDKYLAMHDAGMVRVFTARDDGKLVGYMCFIVAAHLHYAGSVHASQDVLFMDPAYRNAGNGARFIAYADRCLRDEGVQVVIQHVKLAHDFSPLLAHLGYEEVERLHVKRLDR